MKTTTKRRVKAKAKAAPKRAVGPKIDNLNLKQLLELEKRVQKAIHDAQQRERSEILKKMKDIASESGFNLDELVGGPRRGKGKAKSLSVAKFQNPDEPSETWTGRGRKPNWLVARLKKGAKMEQFAI